ncbi:MAG: peptidylprolyl isomerase [Paenibacillaceae bacterium]|uniref:peptidylprolyl isomerase n=1 Tax=Paenibacillus mellifer TaxID=2937794 RepID=A0A9X1Y0R9_9BACL|nr:peptidylprolyl isomerase [Paenibacillus mellifer]MBW4841321.1 peptidylprolyl isomerase [Paenibacillaceae bacterium]MCK8488829.1 peptidylprolyl isomerase [Paenibacillus mellifer]
MEEKDKKELEVTGGETGAAEEETRTSNGQTEPADAVADEPKEAEYDPADDADFIAETDTNSTPVMVSQDEESEAAAVQTSSKSGSKVWPIVSLILAALLIVVLIKPPFATNKAEAVATVNGVEITKDRLFDELAASGGEQALTNLINQELVNQEATKKNITVTDADIDAEIESYKTQFGSEDALNQALVQYGMTLDDLRKQVVMELKLTKLLEPQIKVTDEQIKETFESYKDSFNTPEQVRTSVILVATEQEAKDIVKQLNEGADFAELAKSKSLDPATKEQGGDTDFFARGEKEEAVETAAFKLAKGEISEPVKTTEGYQVIKVTDKKEAHTATLEEKKEEIRKGLVSQQVSSMSGTWLEDVRGKAKITNTLTDASAAE